MLSGLDDLPWHQLSTTFDHVGTSDPRFFDRYWFAFYEPHGEVAMQVTMGVYNNMNVVDAGCVVIRGGKQHNLRLSRALRPQFASEVGGLRIAVEAPLERLRIQLDRGEATDLAFDLMWTAILPPEEENAHFERVRGRVTQEYAKYVQVGRADGWVRVGDEDIAVSDWWACRDHSWGVRPGTGVPEPVTGVAAPPNVTGSLFCWLSFSADALAGSLQLAERSTERTYLTGRLHDRSGEDNRSLRVTGADLGFALYDGTRRFREATFSAELEDGSAAELRCEALGPSVAMPGLGYGGWDDGLGLGVFRGEEHAEGETWDVTHPADVLRADGTRFTPPHRMQPIRVHTRHGGRDDTGTGVLTFIANGALPAYGLS